jgi:DTW domain-containing protein YfiP
MPDERSSPPPHAVARLRAARLAASRRPFLARGSRAQRCPGCRVPAAHCFCALRPSVTTRAGMCLVVHDIEALKPTNTGWLVADLVEDTHAFGWSRTEPDPRLVALLSDPERQPYLVFPDENADPARVVRAVTPAPGRRPLFVILDGAWAQASRMFRRSRWLDALPVLGIRSERRSRYHLRQALRDEHLCTAEVAARCLALAGEEAAARTLDAWLDVFVAHTMDGRSTRAALYAPEADERLAAVLRGEVTAPASG